MEVLQTRKALALFAVLTFGTLAAACGSDDSDTTTTPAASSTVTADGQQHNEADVAFAQEMTSHHAQAVEMADMALDTSLNDELMIMANKIKRRPAA